MSNISYNNWSSMSDAALSEVIGNFVKHHRLQQNKTQKETSKAAGISRSTLSLLERGETVTVTTLIQVLRTLDLLHIMEAFKRPDALQEISPLAYAKLQKNKRQRARSKNKNDNQNTESSW